MSSSLRFANSKLPLNPGKSGWVALLPNRQAKPILDKTINADITIIGAGFAGLAAARRLSQLDPTLKIAVLESSLIGEGPSGRNSGFIIDLPHQVSSSEFSDDSLQKSRDHIVMQRRAVDFAREAAIELNLGREIFDPCGRYTLATTKAGDNHILDYANQLTKLEEAYHLLNANAVANLTGTSTFCSGIFMPGTAIVQPADYVRHLADSLQKPVEVYECSPMQSLEQDGQSWLVKTPKGAVRTQRVVLANNGNAERFGFFRNTFLHIYTYAAMTKAFAPERLAGERAWAATPATPMGTTWRRIKGEDGDRILVRWRYSYNPNLKVSNQALQRTGHRLQKRFAAHFPSIKDVPIEHLWGGAMTLTINSVPAYGEVENGIYAACGCNGLGASNATATGLAVSEIMTGHENDLTRTYARLAKPKKLPPRLITYFGAKAILSMREWRAGDE